MRLPLLLILNLMILLSLFSCVKSNSAGENKAVKTIQKGQENGNVKPYKLDPEKDFIQLQSKGKTEEAAIFIKKALKDTAAIAAKAALDGVLLHFNETEIEDDIMVIGLESDLNKNLTLELISENGVSYIAEGKINVPSALVFKAAKLNKLKTGNYYFILRDDTGNELIKKIKISHRK